MGMVGLIQAAQQQAQSDTGLTCKYILVGGMGPLAGSIIFLILWVKSLLEKNEKLHQEKDVLQDQRLEDFKQRYDKLSSRSRKDKEASDVA